MEIVINYWAVLGAAAAMMVIGALWYGPIFGRVWMKLMGFDRQDMKKMKLSAPMAMGLMFLSTLVISFVMAHFLVLIGARTAGDAVQFALWAWLGFVATTFASLVFFEQRSVKVYLINVGYYFVSFIAAAIILARFV